jgi:hypothetical protein
MARRPRFDTKGGNARVRGFRRPTFLTGGEVLKRLLADADLRGLAFTCTLPAFPHGATWRFRRTDLEKWIERKRRLAR